MRWFRIESAVNINTRARKTSKWLNEMCVHNEDRCLETPKSFSNAGHAALCLWRKLGYERKRISAAMDVFWCDAITPIHVQVDVAPRYSNCHLYSPIPGDMYLYQWMDMWFGNRRKSKTIACRSVFFFLKKVFSACHHSKCICMQTRNARLSCDIS